MAAKGLQKYTLAYVITCAMFVLWGVARCLYDTLMAQFGINFALTSNTVTLIQSLYGLLYFVFAVPAVIYARVLGSKAALVLGLGSWCVGAFLFYPAAQQHALFLFVLALFVMSSGYCFVEISGTPIIAGMGSPERTPLRINFAHALFPLGILATIYTLRWLKLPDLTLPNEHLSHVLLQPYMVIGGLVLLFAFAVDKTRFPPFATQRGKARGAMQEFRILLSRPMFVAAMAAQLGSGAIMAGTWGVYFWYVLAAMPGISVPAAMDWLVLSILLFAIGRLTGAFLMLRFSPESVLAVFAAGGAVSGIVAAFTSGYTGVYALSASSFFVSVLFPTVLGLAIRDLGQLTKAGTALVYIGSSGSGIGLGAMLLVWHLSTVYLAMLIPALCFAGVLAFALCQHKTASAHSASAFPLAAE